MVAIIEIDGADKSCTFLKLILQKYINVLYARASEQAIFGRAPAPIIIIKRLRLQRFKKGWIRLAPPLGILKKTAPGFADSVDQLQ